VEGHSRIPQDIPKRPHGHQLEVTDCDLKIAPPIVRPSQEVAWDSASSKREQTSQPNERTHDHDVDMHGVFTTEDASEHCHALLGEGVGKQRRPPWRELEITNCDLKNPYSPSPSWNMRSAGNRPITSVATMAWLTTRWSIRDDLSSAFSSETVPR